MNSLRDAAKNQRGITVPVLLVLLSLASVAPLIGLSLFSLDHFGRVFKSVDEVSVAGRALSVSSNVDREINGLITAGGTLATSEPLARGDFQTFYDQAKLSMIYAQANVILLDLSLQQLVNTRVPFGTTLPKTSNPDNARKVIETGKVDVSDIFFGKVAQTRVFNVTLPVLVAGEVRYVLIVASKPKRIETVLEQQLLPGGWCAAVSDRTGTVFASTEPELTGKKIEYRLEDRSYAEPAVFDADINGHASIMSFHQSQVTGWTTTVCVPHAVLDAPLAVAWSKLYAASLLAATFGILLAYLFQLPLANLIRQTLAAAAQLGKPGPIPQIRTFLSEGVEIRDRLTALDGELRESQRVAEEGKALLDTLLDHVPEGITIVGGPEFRVIANSKKAIELAGRPLEDLKVLAADHSESFGIWFRDGLTRPVVEQLPLYRASRLGESIAEEYFLVKRPDGTEIEIEVSVNPVRDGAGRIIGAVSCWRDVTMRFAAERLIADNEKRLRLALSVAGMAIIDIDLKNGLVSGLANGPAVLGLDAAAGEGAESALQRLLGLIHPDDRARIETSYKLATATPGPFSGEFRVIRGDGSTGWIETRGEVIAGSGGVPARLLGTNVDISQRKRADEHLQIVLRELTHRAKNLLAIIQAIATQTARRNTTVEDFITAFSRRIQGLGASHDLLVKRDWKGVLLDELVHAQLAPFGGVDGIRIAASGPPVTLKADVLQSLGLALHELATNASKYGALSTPKGTVAIVWSMDGAGLDARFRMSWTERGGPPVKKPGRQGFGHVIIESSLARVVNGGVRLDFERKGISWSVDAPPEAITPRDTSGTFPAAAR